MEVRANDKHTKSASDHNPVRSFETDIPQSPGLSGLWESIWRVEHELGLLDREIDNVRFWPIVRSQVADMLSRELGLFYQERAPLPSSGSRNIFELASPIISHRDLSPWNIDAQFDTILMPFLRKQKQWPADFYTERVLTQPEFGRILVLDFCAGGQARRSPSGQETRSRDYHRALTLSSAIIRVPALLIEVDRLRRELESRFRRGLGATGSLSTFDLALRIAVFSEGRKLARGFIERSGARRLFFSLGQGAGAIAAAAQDCGLQTFEFQHGMIGRYQAAYHFPGRPDVPYAPDVLMLFGQYWADAVDFPGNTRTHIIGSSKLERYRSGPATTKKRQVFVPSQETIGNRLFEIVLAAARLTPDWEYIFRPHPQEQKAQSDWQHAVPGGIPENFTISRTDEDLYEPLARSEVQMGVYSTALFEGMALGARTIVVALPGAEHMAAVIARGDAILARTGAEIAALLSAAPVCRRPVDYYAAPISSLAAIAADVPRGDT